MRGARGFLLVFSLGLLAPWQGSASAQAPPVAPAATGAVQVTENPSPVRNYSSPLIARNPKTGELVTAEVDTRALESARCTFSGTAAAAGGQVGTRW